jgi:hypothetical protein
MLMAITYGNEKFRRSAELNLWTAGHIGKADVTRLYTPEDIDADFAKKNRAILSQPRGAGYWLWKPYIILKSLDTLEENDYLMYTDAGTLYFSSIRPFQAQLEHDGQDIYFSSLFFENQYWSKRDTFVLMGCDSEEYYRAARVSPAYILFRKTERSMEFVRQWLQWMTDARLATDRPSECGLPELPRFLGHRHDESVVSLMVLKLGYQPYRNVNGRYDIKRFRHFYREGDHTFLGTPPEEMEAMSNRMLASKPFQCPYRRLIVNTNMYGHNGPAFWLRVFRRVVQAVWWDCTPLNFGIKRR